MRRFAAPLLLLLAVVGRGQEPGAFAPARSWALVLGATKYTALAPLKYAASDAQMFAASLENDLGFEPKTVRTMTDAGSAKLTRQGIVDALDKMVHDRRFDPGHLFVFYFSGHGIGTPEGDFLCPTDADPKNVAQVGVSVKEVVKRFVDAGMHNVLIVADACREGDKNPFGRELRELGRRANIAVLLGCAPGQRSYENPRTGHGYFTAAIARVLKDESVRDKKFGALWASAVAAKVVEQVSSTTERQFGDAKQVPDMWADPNQDVMLALVPPPVGEGEELLRGVIKTAQDRGKEPYTKMLRALMWAYYDGRHFDKAVDVARSLEGLGVLTPADRGCLLGAYRFLGREREAQSLCAELVRSSPDSYVRDSALIWWNDPSVTPEVRRQASKRIWEADRDFAAADLYWQRWANIDVAAPAAVREVASELVKHFGARSRAGLYFAARLAQFEKDDKTASALLKEARAVEGKEPPERFLLDLEFELLKNLRDYDGMLAVATRGILIDTPDRWILNLTFGFREAPLERRKTVARLALKYSDFGPNYLKAVALLRGDAYLLKEDIAKVVTANPTSVYAHMASMLANLTEKFELPLVRPPALEKLWTDDFYVTSSLYGAVYDAATDAVATKRLDKSAARLVVAAAFLPFLDHLAELRSSLIGAGHAYAFSAFRDTTGQLSLLAERSLGQLVADPAGQETLRLAWFLKLCAVGRLDLALAGLKAGGWGVDEDSVVLRYAIARGMSGDWADGIEWFNKIKAPSSQRMRHQMWALAHFNRITRGTDKDLEDFEKNAPRVTDPVAKRLVWLSKMALAFGVKKGDKPDPVALQGLLPQFESMLDPVDLDMSSRVLVNAWRAQAVLVPERVKRDEYVLRYQDAREGSPVFDGLPWIIPSTVKDFVGTTVLKGTARFDDGAKPVDATLTVVCADDGKAEITIERGGQPKVTLPGVVTRFGAFRGGDGKTVVSGRLMPPAVAKLRPDIAREGVRVALWDEKCAQWTFQFDVPR
ncbi:MAG: caspase family protein [Fimbriimonadaceae bacterium]|nr:caspase family protein [Fimbriimonadaceae bacterium]